MQNFSEVRLTIHDIKQNKIFTKCHIVSDIITHWHLLITVSGKNQKKTAIREQLCFIYTNSEQMSKCHKSSAKVAILVLSLQKYKLI